MVYDSKNCIVHVPKDKLVVLQGLEDYIVVESDNILMICKKQDEQQIRNFVNDVKVNKAKNSFNWLLSSFCLKLFNKILVIITVLVYFRLCQVIFFINFVT